MLLTRGRDLGSAPTRGLLYEPKSIAELDGWGSTFMVQVALWRIGRRDSPMHTTAVSSAGRLALDRRKYSVCEVQEQRGAE